MPSLTAVVTQAKDNLTSSFNNISNISHEIFLVAEQLERRAKELDQKEKELIEREERLEARIKALEEREREDRERSANQEEPRGRPKSPSFGDRVGGGKFLSAVHKINPNVHITVGPSQAGVKHYTIAKSELRKSSYLNNLVESQNSSNIFVPRDYKLFEYVFEYLITGRLHIKNAEKQKKVENELAFFKIPFTPSAPLLVTHRAKVRGELIAESLGALRGWFPNFPNPRFNLLYKASVDGFHAAGFHHFCDNKGPTITLVRVKKADKDYVFGGYSPIPWQSPEYSSYKSDANCFIFTISNPHDIPPTKYSLKKNSAKDKHDKYAVFVSSEFIASFGRGCDLKVFADANLHSDSYTNFPSDYEDTTGRGNTTFTGEKNFRADEVEVYSISG